MNKNIHKFIITTILFLFGGMEQSGFVWALEYENPFITPELPNQVKSFLVYEIKTDFKNAINKYNDERKKPKLDAKLQKWNKVDIQKIKEFPEITFNEDSQFIMLHGKNKISFTIDLILRGEYYLNQSLQAFSDRPMLFDLTSKVSDANNLNIYNNKNNDESISTLTAAILALAEKYQETGLLCMFDCQNEMVQKNQAKLLAKINRYTAKCENDLANRANNMATFYYTKNFDVMNEISSDDYKLTYNFLNEVSGLENENPIGSAKDSGRNIANSTHSKFSTDTQHSCPLTIGSVFKIYSPEIFMDNYTQSLQAKETMAICENINALKRCVSNFYDQAAAVYDNSKNKYIEKSKRIPATNIKE